jgi:hypothetical protein
MNYKKIYRSIIIKAKNENRIKTNDVYFEKHHIIPDFMFRERKRKGPKGHLPGNPNDPDNLILLTPREHLICHILLFKISKGSRYEYQSGSALQFFFSKTIGAHPRSKFFVGSRKYEKYKLQGLESISKARKGKMPVKDAKTGKIIGSMSITHPCVLSGEWVHATKGRTFDQKYKDKMSLLNSGSNNPNYKNFAHSELLEVLKTCVVNKFCKYKDFILAFNKDKTKKESISKNYISNHYGGWEKFLEFAKNSGIEVEYHGKYFRSQSQRILLSEKNKIKRWVNNSIEEKQIDLPKLDEFLKNNQDYIKGRLKC